MQSCALKRTSHLELKGLDEWMREQETKDWIYMVHLIWHTVMSSCCKKQNVIATF